MSIQMRLFIGCLKNKEMTFHLEQSNLWKEAKIVGREDLIEAQHEEKVYIGRFIPSMLSGSQLKKIEEKIKSQLQLYCPKLNLDRQHTYLLSQLFFL